MICQASSCPNCCNPNILHLRPYQQQGIDFLHAHERAMLADAPGLGKTLQASEAAVKPVLISAPIYLTDQWFDFLVNQYPHDRIVLASGYRKQREKALKHKDIDWTIINHSMLRADFDLPQPETMILDESHHFKNKDSKQSRAVAKFTKKHSTPLRAHSNASC